MSEADRVADGARAPSSGNALARVLSEQLVDLDDEQARIPDTMAALEAELAAVRGRLADSDVDATAVRAGLRRRICDLENSVDGVDAHRRALAAATAAVRARASEEALTLVAPKTIRAERARAGLEGQRRQWFERQRRTLGIGYGHWRQQMGAALENNDTETLARNGLRTEGGAAVPILGGTNP